MDYKDNDDKIKNKSYYKYNKVPDNIENIINDTLQNLKLKKKINYSKIAVAVFLFIIITSGLGVTTTAFAVGIPIKDVIAEIMGLAPKYQDYASDVNITKESNGVNLTITSVLFDGYKLKISYKVESKTIPLEENDWSSYILNQPITVNGKKVMLQGSDSGMYKDQNTILGTANLDFDTDNSNPFMWITKMDIINTFNFGININQNYKGQKCSWDFNIPISSEKIKEQIKKYKVNSIVGNQNIKSIIVTPLSIYINGDVKSNDDDKKILNCIVLDEKGREYGLNNGNESSGVLGGKFNYEFNNNNDNVIKSLKFIPYESKKGGTNENQSDKKVKYDTLNITLDDNGFNAQDTDIIKITNVIRYENTTNIYYKSKYPLTVALFPKLSEESYESNNYMTVQKIECLEEGNGVLVLNRKMENGVYDFTYNNIKESMNLFEDKSVIVELK